MIDIHSSFISQKHVPDMLAKVKIQIFKDFYASAKRQWFKHSLRPGGASGYFIIVGSCKDLGPVSIIRPSFPGMGIPMLKIIRSRDRLIFNMGIPILVRRHLYIETAPCFLIGTKPLAEACLLLIFVMRLLSMRHPWSVSGEICDLMTCKELRDLKQWANMSPRYIQNPYLISKYQRLSWHLTVLCHQLVQWWLE